LAGSGVLEGDKETATVFAATIERERECECGAAIATGTLTAITTAATAATILKGRPGNEPSRAP
jgi:hypothetical protein